MKFRSKPHTIEAFQFKADLKQEYPDWFMEAMKIGKTFVVINSKEQFILVETKGGEHKAYTDSWVCLNSHNTMFVMSDEEIKNNFEMIVDSENELSV